MTFKSQAEASDFIGQARDGGAASFQGQPMPSDYAKRGSANTLAQMTNPFVTKNKLPSSNQTTLSNQQPNFSREQEQYEEQKQSAGYQKENEHLIENGDPSSSSMSGYDFRNMFNRVQQQQQHQHHQQQHQPQHPHHLH